MAVNVKMGVDIGSFTSGIKQGQQILKGLNAEMKASESEFKATGDAEKKLNSQTKTLNSQLNVQKGIAQQARQALKAMKDQGVDPADAAYQKMYITLMNAEAGANEAQAALNALGSSAENAAGGADKLSDSLGSIKNKMSLEQVVSGINSITTGLENAAKKAVQLGEQIWNAVMDKAQWADDTATMAQMYGIDLDTFQRMQKLVTNGLDTSVEAMLKSQKKLRKGIGEESEATMQVLEQLGLAFSSGKDKSAQLITDDQTELFWKAGQALMNMSDAAKQEAAAQDLFGRSWEELVPLFSTYKTAEEYQKALEGVYVVSEEGVNALAELNDKYNELKGNFDTLSTEIMGALAPALTKAAEALNGLLTKVLEYLKTDEGKQALKDMETAVSGLFDDLGKIDPDKVVSGFTEVFNTVVESLQWLSNNWSGVVTALEGIVAGWAALKITGGILDIVKIVNGLTTLTTGSAAKAGAAAGASWGSSFAGAVLKAAPWLLPIALGIWQVSNYQRLMEEGKIKAAEDRAHVVEATAEMTTAMQDPEFAKTWEEATSHTMSTNTVNSDVLQDWAKRYDEWITTMGNDPIMDTLVENLSEDTFGELETLMQNVLDGATMDPQAVIDTLGKVQDELEASGKEMEIPGLIEIPADTAAQLTSEIGTVIIQGKVVTDEDGSHANGLAYVPYDGYLARLHKGERVVTAREVQSRSYNSNLYVESMVMNNGTDAAGLAAAIAAAQRRTMSGYGS